MIHGQAGLWDIYSTYIYSISHEICTWFCCVLFYCGYMYSGTLLLHRHSLYVFYQFLWIYRPYFTISFRVTSLALGQSYDCPSASEVTLKDMGNIDHYQTTTKHTCIFLVCLTDFIDLCAYDESCFVNVWMLNNIILTGRLCWLFCYIWYINENQSKFHEKWL